MYRQRNKSTSGMAPEAKVVLAIGSSLKSRASAADSTKVVAKSPSKLFKREDVELGQKRKREEFNRFIEDDSDQEQKVAYKRPKRTFEDSPDRQPSNDAQSGSEENWLPGAGLTKLNKE